MGKNLTKGVSYRLINKKTTDHKKKVFLIYDVPEFFNLDTSIIPENLKLHKIKQYPGFLIDLEAHRDLNGYMTSTFGKSSRYKLNKYKKRLEFSFDITYKMFYGEIAKTEYDWLFEQFKQLLQKRFSEKQTTNNNLDPGEWDFYYDVAYPMILEKKASLFVIYDGLTPIGITLNYFSDNVLFDAITVFDVDYAKFHVGSVTIMKLIEWSIEQKFKILDFSKGYFDYKKRWANKEYDFEYHIYYDATSIFSIGMAAAITNFFKLKQELRKRKLNEKLHQFTFLLKNKSNHNKTNVGHEFFEIEQNQSRDDMMEVDLGIPENHFLKTVVFDFLYLYNESYSDLSVFKKTDLENTLFLFHGKTANVKVQLLQ